MPSFENSFDTSSGFISADDLSSLTSKQAEGSETNEMDDWRDTMSNNAEFCLIGTGRANAVGHVIEGSVWRPW